MSANPKIPADRLSATLSLDEPVTVLPQIQSSRAKALAKLSIHSVRDLLTHYPRRYRDLSSIVPIARTRIGDRVTILATIDDITLKRPRRGLELVELALVDDSAMLVATFFGQPWLRNNLTVGDKLIVNGIVDFSYGFKRMANPYWEKHDPEKPHPAIVPIHGATAGLSDQWIRRFVQSALTLTAGLFDPLPLTLRQRRSLISRGRALYDIHFPQTMVAKDEARRRLVYEELFFLELHLMYQSYQRALGKPAHRHHVHGEKMNRWVRNLPFALTSDQQQAVEELLASMADDHEMNRLLLGDVGTGKTIVAAFGMVAAADSHTQALLMAPTEVLARQHFEHLSPLLSAAGVHAGLLTGSTPQEVRGELLADFSAGRLDCLIGTHALLEKPVQPYDLSLVIIDEQQRFGVEQRSALLAKGEGVDALYLTATPIPRTLALAIYGHLELSYLTERPHELHRRTRVLAHSIAGDAYEEARSALARGEQVYVVCPLINDTSSSKKRSRIEDEEDELAIAIEDDADYVTDGVGATRRAESLQTGVFRDYRVGLLHGGLNAAEKADVMERFRCGEIQVLVATTIIEVGVDVANASVMIIEDADRFGLSQLHQLRGRVGRQGTDASVFLISSSTNPIALRRLSAMESSDDGFELAAYDLSLRREGDILGNRQHGTSTLKLVNIIRDGDLIKTAHGDAAALIAADPTLQAPEHRALHREMRILFGEDDAERVHA